MLKYPTPSQLLSVVAVLVGLLLVSFIVVGPVTTTTVALQDEGNAVRGGLLYDKWWAVDADAAEEDHDHDEDDHGEVGEAPEGDHPLWATQDTNTRSGADTWRCKECHGWDYQGVDGAYGSGSHYTGFPGVMDSQDKSFDELMTAMTGGTNPDHDFSTFMPEEDLVDLVTFISEGLIDTSVLLNDDNTSAGDATHGSELYAQVCTLCHGPDGNAINFHGFDEPEFVGHIAADNPWEFFHKVRFGQPGWPMPSAISNGWSDQDVADVLAYAETFTTDPALSGGGLLYDRWWTVIEVDAPEGNHPLWATQDTNTRSGADTWRCKECHGWDYQGSDGAYGSGSHFTGFTGVLDASTMSTEDLLTWLKGEANPDHDFSDFMDENTLNALVAFIQTEMMDITTLVNDDGAVNGDPRNGRDLYGGTCTACHGADGRMINFGDDEEPEYLGTVASGNPWEFYHKASFGQPGSPMPSGIALGWTTQDIADVLAFAQTLPTE